MINKTALFVFALAAAPSAALSNNEFETLAGFRLGQECSGQKFTKQKSDVSNPKDTLDTISALRNQHESVTSGGHVIRVFCSIIDNRIHHVSLTAQTSTAISEIKDSLKEKMGRAPDDSSKVSSKPQRLLGVTMDGHGIESEYWNLSGNRKATAYTIIMQPYGSTSISQLKWRGGIELSYPGTRDLEWIHLKERGLKSSKEEDASHEKKRKDSIKGLLN